MIIELPNGKRVYLSLDQYFSMSDTDFNEMTRIGTGSYGGNSYSDDDVSYIDGVVIIEEDIIIEESRDLTDIDFDEKISDKDFFNEDEY